jgi:hypothetical protein
MLTVADDGALTQQRNNRLLFHDPERFRGPAFTTALFL